MHSGAQPGVFLRGQTFPTGEDKTLAAVAPVYLNASTGRGVHVLTFNDYLARRDADWVDPVYRPLGFSVRCVQQQTEIAGRRDAYTCHVTYLTAKRAGFDHLRVFKDRMEAF